MSLKEVDWDTQYILHDPNVKSNQRNEISKKKSFMFIPSMFFWSKFKTIWYSSGKQPCNCFDEIWYRSSFFILQQKVFKRNLSLISSNSRNWQVFLKASNSFVEICKQSEILLNFCQKFTYCLAARKQNGFNFRLLPIDHLNDLRTWKQTCVHRGNGASWQEARKLCDQPTPSSSTIHC